MLIKSIINEVISMDIDKNIIHKKCGGEIDLEIEGYEADFLNFKCKKCDFKVVLHS